MRLTRLIAAGVIALTATASLVPASAAPLAAIQGLSQGASQPLETIQYYRRGPYPGPYPYGGYGYRRHNNTGALIGGLAAGAIIGGAIAASQAQATAQRNAAWCAQRYRSYDPASGTYLNYDGNRYPCP